MLLTAHFLKLTVFHHHSSTTQTPIAAPERSQYDERYWVSAVPQYACAFWTSKTNTDVSNGQHVPDLQERVCSSSLKLVHLIDTDQCQCQAWKGHEARGFSQPSRSNRWNWWWCRGAASEIEAHKAINTTQGQFNGHTATFGHRQSKKKSWRFCGTRWKPQLRRGNPTALCLLCKDLFTTY